MPPVIRTDMGDLCHFRDTSVPITVVTDLKGNIIFSNQVDPDKPEWSTTGGRVMITRFWAASTAYVMLACPDLSTDLPEYPHDKAGIEREVCVWMGYLDFLRRATASDLGTRLLRVFVGVIDVVQATASGTGGITVALQMRDRVRWLMDSEVTYNPALDEKVGEMPLRSDLILEVAQRGIGQVEGDDGCAVCGKKIQWDAEYLYDLGDTSTFPTSNQVSGSTASATPTPTPEAAPGTEPIANNISSIPPANLWYQEGQPLIGSTKTSRIDVEENPYFRIYTTRSAIQLQEGTNFLINQQVPVDIIKFLAAQECYPTELFQDNRDGNFYYCPRANDATGLKDAKRFLRTYYFKVHPATYPVDGGNAAPPDYNQMMLSFREEQSSIGLKTNFIVHKSAMTAEGGGQDDWSIHLKAIPKKLEGVNFACKFYKVYDETITSIEEAAVVALNAARVWSKEVRAATAVVIGDPSLVPGEIIQCIGSPLQPKRGLESAASDRTLFQEFDAAYNNNLKTYAEQAIKNAGLTGGDISAGQEITLPVHDGSQATVKVEANEQQNQNSITCQTSSKIDTSTSKGDPQTMFRIEAIIFKNNIGGKGFTSELALCTPF